MRKMRNLVLTTMATLLALTLLAPAASAQEFNNVLTLEEQFELSFEDQQAYWHQLRDRAADIRHASEIALDSQSDGSATVVNYCEYEDDVAACNAAFNEARALAFELGVHDGRRAIERAGRPANPLVFDNVSAQRGADNGIVVGWYHGKAYGLGFELARWEGLNDCLTGHGAVPNVETWIGNLLYSEDVGEQLFAARVIEGIQANYGRGYRDCQNGVDSTLFAGLYGQWRGISDHLQVIDPSFMYFGPADRLDPELLERAEHGYDLGRERTHNALVDGTFSYGILQWRTLDYQTVAFVPES